MKENAKFYSSMGYIPADHELALRIASILTGIPVKFKKFDEPYYYNVEKKHFKVNLSRQNVKRIELFSKSQVDHANFWVIANAINSLLGRK